MKIIIKPFSIAALIVASTTALNAQQLLNGDFSDVAPSSPSPLAAGTYEANNPPTYFIGESGTSDPSGDTTGPETFGFSTDQNGGVISDTFYAGFTASPTPYDVFFKPDNNFSSMPYASGNPDITGLYQDLGALKPLTKYTVQIYESTGSTSSSNSGATFQLALYNGTDSSTTPVATTTDSFAAPTGDAVFTPETVSFTTGAAVSGDLTFGVSSYDDISLGEASGQDFIADATLTSTSVAPLTPEPSSWVLVLLGMGGLAMGIRRKITGNL